ncbi:GH92 family glycosyl hydrolase [Carboxylicivirga sp. A043]|uniref:GH92 family glycosyl hydrolase n=1 Tax=Carboxylicivirga litoralis TaxID=2816963 RepID=UPI0021CB6F96|nr:GH92 family glycosyl hydrolase [Carboxylicivirga sp. A043]MCU4154741.1 GH92 family glycosyl hydrolase [Carboxylicivirga sp. A043]
MMRLGKHAVFLVLALLLVTSCDDTKTTNCLVVEDPVEYVNTLMGTDSEFALSNGNTYPAVATPWGMNFWTPQTNKMGDGWAYQYDAHKIRGIKQTHQPSPWINDYAAFSLMAVTGELKFKENERASWFSHKAETARPHYYQVYLADYDVNVEVSPTERAAQFRFTFPENEESYVLVDGFHQGSYVKVIPEERKLIGYCKNNSGGVPENFHNYFVIEFDKDIAGVKTWNKDELIDANEQEGYHVGAVIQFQTKKGEQVHAKVASSFISYEQAQLNLEREIGKDSFDTTKEKAYQAWRTELDKIKIEGGTIDQQRIFYSTLYRVLLFPRKFFEYDQNNKVVHYSPYNGKVLPGYMFTDNGFWDTFRAVFPFFTIMYPELNNQIMEGLVNTYKESGWLPEWASPGHRGCMIGSNSAVNIADAYLKGMRDYDIETLYEAIIKNTNGYLEDITSVGRYGASYYNELGYVPYDVGIHENAARTLEYAFADYNIYKLAKALNKPQDEIDLFAKRAQNYKNLFCPDNKLMRGKNADGTFQEPFSEFKWGGAFTEGNSWHYTWSVFHDIEGLKQLMGGNEAFVSQLDKVFELPPVFDDSYYGFPIHEIREMQIMNMGQYAHGNQPIQHMTYLYNYAGQPWKSQYWVRKVMDKLYTPNPDGYCGDEDNGQTSAWYVFSAMGFYPVCPGQDMYVFGSPIFDKVNVSLPNGKKLVISSENNGIDNVYVNSLMVNGNTWNKNYITHDDLLNGGELHFKMDAEPNKQRGINADSYPPSMSTEKE